MIPLAVVAVASNNTGQGHETQVSVPPRVVEAENEIAETTSVIVCAVAVFPTVTPDILVPSAKAADVSSVKNITSKK
jgi:hypothetical protein